MGKFLSHSGATYLPVPLIPVRVLEWSGINNFSNPKSAIFAHPCSSVNMLLGLRSQWMMWVLHSSCSQRVFHCSYTHTPRAC
ncbi:hypothetical protein I3842_15G017800 [Carya illinoinensis]|uniref:Uncharacterized protein n=1 Tax=Carya illinoinensis TaxID=32201 RepID=A0A922DA01_CARIL|nr:hypothetical protein I3842_15G017800 [Carya illinoinensis]